MGHAEGHSHGFAPIGSGFKSLDEISRDGLGFD